MSRPIRPLALAVALAGALAACVEASTEHRIRANALFKAGDYSGALAECERGLASKPEDVSLWVVKGKTAFELADFGSARSAYAQAISLGHGKRGVFLADAYLGLAVIATREQKWDEARREFLHLL